MESGKNLSKTANSAIEEYIRYSNFTAREEPAKMPKRVYKNPLLQKLADRWYGFEDSHDYVDITIHIKPKNHRIVVLNMDIPPVPAYTMEPRVFTECLTKIFEFPSLAYKYRCSKKFLSINRQYMWSDLHKKLPIILKEHLINTEQI